jgi:predicted kinase
LLAAYARRGGDFDLYRVVDFYQSYRAFVRGKVAAWMAADSKLGPQAREHARAQARRCFRLALSARQRPVLEAQLIAVGGWIGAGKSTVAERVAEHRSCPWVSADLLRKQHAGVAGTHSLAAPAWSGAYSEQNTAEVYAALLRAARCILESGRSVVLDASFRSAAQRSAARNLASELGVPFHFVECRASTEVCRQRLESRAKGPSISDGRVEIFDDFVARFEKVDELSAREHSVVDTTLPLDDNVARLMDRLGVVPAGFVS